MAANLQTVYQMHLDKVFDWNFPVKCFYESFCEWFRIGSGNGSARKWRQSITWNNDNPNPWRKHTSLRLIMLIDMLLACLIMGSLIMGLSSPDIDLLLTRFADCNIAN